MATIVFRARATAEHKYNMFSAFDTISCERFLGRWVRARTGQRLSHADREDNM